MTAPTSPAPRSSLAPLRVPAFRRIWIAQLGSNVGTWMQTVGAQWLLVTQPNATTLVALVQAASLTPVLFLSLPAGVLADVVDRRQLMLWISVAMAAIAGALAWLTGADLDTPALLITITVLLGCAQALLNPAQQAVLPELVERADIPAASALGGLSINVARAVGPALAGVLVATSGAALVFALNAVSFLGMALAALLWRTAPVAVERPERALPALLAGGRYVRSAPAIRRLLLRSGLFVVPASALWALLPVVASDRLGLGSAGYGLLLGALGAGSIAAAAVMGPIRRSVTPTALLAMGTVAFTLGTAVAAAATSAWVLAPVLVVAGAGWLAILATLNALLQLTLPPWVRARGLATYMIVFLGGQGLASMAFGVIGTALGVPATLWLAAAALVLSALSLRWWPVLSRTANLDRTPAVLGGSDGSWSVPNLVFEPDEDAGPVLVTVEYVVRPAEVARFLELMAPLELSRRRTGASRWAVYRDANAVDRFVEEFAVPSWDEHQRQHNERLTGFDLEIHDAVFAVVENDPEVHHLLRLDPRRPPRD